MPDAELIGRLGVWEGYKVVAVERVEAGEAHARPQVRVELEPESTESMTCDGCGRSVSSVHDVAERWIRDLPIFDAETYLKVKRRRVLCPECGPKLERLPWLHRYARVTSRLAESAARLCQVMSIKHVAAFFGLGWDTVKEIDKAALIAKVGEPNLDGLEIIGMDEFAIHKGHRYATVIVEPTRKRVLWVGPGRERETVRQFFELLGPDRTKRLKAVVMDMFAAFRMEVQAQAPQADIVFDLFHVAARYGREVIDRVRVDEANRLTHDKRARKVVKGSKWLLLRNRENVTRREDRVRLTELLNANRALLKVYLMRDELKRLWGYRHHAWAQKAWNDWYRRAVRSRIKPLVRFAKNLAVQAHGILAHSRWPLSTRIIEGINNRIKVIKRMAYGFRDDAYFFLKIRAAFPGTAG